MCTHQLIAVTDSCLTHIYHCVMNCQNLEQNGKTFYFIRDMNTILLMSANTYLVVGIIMLFADDNDTTYKMVLDTPDPHKAVKHCDLALSSFF